MAAAFLVCLTVYNAVREEFNAVVQGERGKELTDEAVTRLREDIGNFQHLTRSAAPGGPAIQ